MYECNVIAMNGDEQRNKFGHSTFCWIFAVWLSVDTFFAQSQLFLTMNKARRPCNKGWPKFRTTNSFRNRRCLVFCAGAVSHSN